MGEEIAPTSFQKELLDKKKLTISDVAELLPSYDLKKQAKRKTSTHTSDTTPVLKSIGQLSILERKRKMDRTSALAGEAWDNIYNWHFLNWLQYDDWSWLVPVTKKRCYTEYPG